MSAPQHDYYLRERHVSLDQYRTFNPVFNHAWFMFFGTVPPGINKRTTNNRGRDAAAEVLRLFANT